MGRRIAAVLVLLTVCAAAAPRPNVLFIAIDDLNDWVGCMGGHPNAKTPNIDALVARGTLFTNAHCQAPICGPSRASLLTGLRPSTTGIYGQIPDLKIAEASPAAGRAVLLPDYLETQGYRTFGCGKIFHNGDKIGQVSSGGYGFTVGKSLAFGYIRPDCAEPGTELEVMILGEKYPARVLGEPLYDPESLLPRT